MGWVDMRLALLVAAALLPLAVAVGTTAWMGSFDGRDEPAPWVLPALRLLGLVPLLLLAWRTGRRVTLRVAAAAALYEVAALPIAALWGPVMGIHAFAVPFALVGAVVAERDAARPQVLPLRIGAAMALAVFGLFAWFHHALGGFSPLTPPLWVRAGIPVALAGSVLVGGLLLARDRRWASWAGAALAALLLVLLVASGLEGEVPRERAVALVQSPFLVPPLVVALAAWPVEAR